MRLCNGGQDNAVGMYVGLRTPHLRVTGHNIKTGQWGTPSPVVEWALGVPSLR
jgi:hypothetical protein